jgi:hypothetical protein
MPQCFDRQEQMHPQVETYLGALSNNTSELVESKFPDALLHVLIIYFQVYKNQVGFKQYRCLSCI